MTPHVQLERNKRHLFNYMIFLRITPLLPNWFINISAPGVWLMYGVWLACDVCHNYLVWCVVCGVMCDVMCGVICGVIDCSLHAYVLI